MMAPSAPHRKILIEKRARRLTVAGVDTVHGPYPVDLGAHWAADKAVEGDRATPLGEFYICAKNPRSRFFLSLCISYPNAEDAARGIAAGLISDAEYAQIIDAIRRIAMPPQRTKLGGEIYIHGRTPRHEADRDWTRGCVALANADMQVVYDLAVIGTPVTIVD
jgi:murein L,D-transpeptidase YafK